MPRPATTLTKVSRGRLLFLNGDFEVAMLAAGAEASDVARETGVSPSTVRKWLRGDRVPRAAAASRAAEVYDRLVEQVRSAFREVSA